MKTLILNLLLVLCTNLMAQNNSQPLAASFTQKLLDTAVNGTSTPLLGSAIDVEGDWLAIGDPADSGRGAVHLFHFNHASQNWQYQSKIVPQDIRANDGFGTAVSLFNQSLLIGAENAPRAYLYEYSTTSETWLHSNSIIPALNDFNPQLVSFGTTVKLFGNKAFISYEPRGLFPVITPAHYAYYEYETAQQQWSYGGMVPSQNNSSHLGRAIALSADYLFIGQPSHRLQEIDSRPGNVVVYQYDQTNQLWQEHQTILAPVPQDGAQFGNDLSVSGNRLLISSDKENSAQENTGAVYTYTFNDDNQEWVYQQKITAIGALGNDFFGHDISLSGNIATISNQHNQAYVYVYSSANNTWLQTDTLVPSSPDPNSRSNRLITTQETIFLSTFYGTSPSSIHVFERASLSNWPQSATLSVGPGLYNTRLGSKTALNDHYAITVSTQNYTFNDTIDIAHIFKKTANSNTWTLDSKLQPPFSLHNVQYTSAVSTTEDWLATGIAPQAQQENMPGFVLIYQHDKQTDNWQQVAELTAPDNVENVSDSFGFSVDITDDRMVIGALNGHGQQQRSGAVYVYELNNTTENWDFIDKLVADNTDHSNSFGYQLAQYGSTIAVSTLSDTFYIFDKINGQWNGQAISTTDDISSIAITENHLFATGYKKIHIYSKDSINQQWLPSQTLPAPNTSDNDFGTSIKVTNDLLLVGSPYDYGCSNDDQPQSLVYLYRFNQNLQLWTLTQNIIKNEQTDCSRFGASIDINNQTIIIGAPGDDQTGNNSGAAYIYQLENDVIFANAFEAAN